MRTRSFVIAGVVIFFLALSTMAVAADPIVGTWKINASKSKLAPVGSWLKEATMTFREGGGLLFADIKGTNIDGTPYASKGNRPLPGGIVKSEPPYAEGTVLYITVIGPGDSYLSTFQNGIQTLLDHYFVSKDGKTLTWTSKGTDEKGKPAEAVYVLDRQ